MKKNIFILFFCLFFSSCCVQNDNVNTRPKKRIIIEYRWSTSNYWNTYPSPYHNYHQNRPRGHNNGPRR